MPQRLVFLDTSFILALENRDDPYHERAKELDVELAGQGVVYLLHWGILLEIGDGYARFNRRAKGAELLQMFQQESGYQIVSLSEQLLIESMNLYQQRLDKNWGLTDCVSFVLMQQAGVHDALTADAHFRQAGFHALLLD